MQAFYGDGEALQCDNEVCSPLGVPVAGLWTGGVAGDIPCPSTSTLLPFFSVNLVCAAHIADTVCLATKPCGVQHLHCCVSTNPPLGTALHTSLPCSPLSPQVRLQCIVPYLVTLLGDAAAGVRAMALRCLVKVMCSVSVSVEWGSVESWGVSVGHSVGSQTSV